MSTASSPPQVEGTVNADVSADSATPNDRFGAGPVLVDRLLVEEWIVFSAQRVWWGAGAKVSRADRERALQRVTRIRDVAALARIDLDQVGTDETEERLVDLSADDDREASLGWDLATGEQEIRKRIELDAMRPTTKSKRRSR